MSIPGPKGVKPDYAFHVDAEPVQSPARKLGSAVADLVRVPVHWIRENVVEKNRGPKTYWYHRKYNPALPVDECFIDDPVCVYEATREMERLRLVDKATLNILRYRRETCRFWEMTTQSNNNYAMEACKDIEDTYNREEINFFLKFGDLSWFANAVDVFNKQKHRMIVERRRAIREKEAERSEAKD